MSADNLVQAFHFKKKTGQEVWRVMEVTMSGFPMETVLYMSTKMYDKRFIEFSGPNAAKQAAAAATRAMRKLPICEYGTSVSSAQEPALTMAQLCEQAREAGYDVYDLEEADDNFWRGKEVPYYLE